MRFFREGGCCCIIQDNGTILRSELADELRQEGIYCKGYGTVPKLVMVDPELSCEAKAIYAYFCAYSGAGNCAFPGREKILADLGMSKDAYYRHYHLLLENDYIRVRQERTTGSQYQNNIYTLINEPEKYRNQLRDSRKSEMKIRLSGLRSGGYGMIPKALMTDRRLSVKAKGLYAYYAAFTGSGESAFPEKSVAMAHLGIGVHSMEKLNKELITLNLIVIRQRHINGRLSVNDVYLVDHPDETMADCSHVIRKIEQNEKQCYEKQDTEQGKTKFQFSKKQDTEKPDAKKQDSETQDAIIKQADKKQNEKENRIQQRDDRPAAFRKKLADYAVLTGKAGRQKQYSAKKKEKQDNAIRTMLDRGTLPAEWQKDREMMRAAIEILTEDEILGNEKAYEDLPDGNLAYFRFCLYRDSLIDLLTAETPFKIEQNRITAEEVLEKLAGHIRIDAQELELSIPDLFEHASELYRRAEETTGIRVPKKFMAVCIWNSLSAAD